MRAFPAVLAAILFFSSAAAAIPAPSSPAQLRRGAALLCKDCGACHAVGRTGASPVKGAPAFRTSGGVIRSNPWRRRWRKAS